MRTSVRTSGVILGCLALLWSGLGWAQGLVLNAQQQFLDANGKPLAGGFVYTYVVGTTTPFVTYVDPGLSVANTDPIVLDGAGRATIWAPAGQLREMLTDSLGNLIWDRTTAVPLGGQISSAVAVTNTTNSTSPTTGAITDLGGLGVSGNVWVGGGLNAVGATSLAGTLSVTGAVTGSSSLTVGNGLVADSVGHLRAGAGSGAPTVACPLAGEGTVIGTDNAMSITLQNNASQCTITFAHAWSATPMCWGTSGLSPTPSTPAPTSVSSTSVVVTFGSATTGQNMYVFCLN